jgi:hypothetical protein
MLNSKLSTEEFPMAKKHLKKFKVSSNQGNENQMNLRFHLTPIRMSKIKNSGGSRCWQGYRERGVLLCCWWDFKVVQLLWKLIW